MASRRQAGRRRCSCSGTQARLLMLTVVDYVEDIYRFYRSIEGLQNRENRGGYRVLRGGTVSVKDFLCISDTPSAKSRAYFEDSDDGSEEQVRWLIEEIEYSITISQFASILGLHASDLSKVDLHLLLPLKKQSGGWGVCASSLTPSNPSSAEDFWIQGKSAFLNGPISELVYREQPLGFEDPKHPEHVYKLHKVLYGLKQAPRAWYECLRDFLAQNGFEIGKTDTTLFTKKFKNDLCR
uniref:Reverse transcriptase Ty1/copia-type domain-containing protein n=1 Tax=Oryza brachyantha TaxID=4533 RepID=J3KYV0_ORYBR